MNDLPPANILLATDLSARCDRALDRAAILGRHWRSNLVVVHAVEPAAEAASGLFENELPSWRGASDAERVTRDRIRHDLLDLPEEIGFDVHVEPGQPADIILATCERRGCGLIVVGTDSGDPFRHVSLGSTVNRLIRKAKVPVLVVRERVRADYAGLVVATDFSASSRLALETAARLFPDARLSLFHGFELPFAFYLGEAELAANLDQLGGQAADRFLAEADIAPERAQQIGRLIEHGVPERLLHDLGTRNPGHLVVVGSHGGGAVYDFVIGSTARKIIEAVPGDVLLVPDPGGRQG